MKKKMEQIQIVKPRSLNKIFIPLSVVIVIGSTAIGYVVYGLDWLDGRYDKKYDADRERESLRREMQIHIKNIDNNITEIQKDIRALRNHR